VLPKGGNGIIVSNELRNMMLGERGVLEPLDGPGSCSSSLALLDLGYPILQPKRGLVIVKKWVTTRYEAKAIVRGRLQTPIARPCDWAHAGREAELVMI
jgi:hypothetical protein